MIRLISAGFQATALLRLDRLDDPEEAVLSIQQNVDRLHELNLKWAGLMDTGRVVGAIGILKVCERRAETLVNVLDVLQAMRKRLGLPTHAGKYDATRVHPNRYGQIGPRTTSEEFHMYKLVDPSAGRSLPLRMQFEPVKDGRYSRTCEADSFRGLVAALIDDPRYERGALLDRFVDRLRLGINLRLWSAISGHRPYSISDHDDPDTVNVSSDESLISSLNRLGFLAFEMVSTPTGGPAVERDDN